MILYDYQNKVLFNQPNMKPYIRKTGDMVNGDVWELDFNAVNKNHITTFTGYLNGASMGKIAIGKHPNYSYGTYFEVDGTYLYVRNLSASDQEGTKHEHGLTFTDVFQFIYSVDSYCKATVQVLANGAEFKLEDVGHTTLGTNMFVEVAGMTLTNCTYVWTCKDLTAPIWIFGDSWIPTTTPERWPYYAVQAGFGDNFLVDGYGGEYSTWSIQAFRSLLTHGNPKFVLWCLGMNSNSDWEPNFHEVIATCKKRGITPVFTTIPNAVSYSYATEKNQLIYDSGCRYIDFAKVCGAEGTDREWFTGMGTDDGVHPTEAGARALWAQVLADFPEIVTGY